MRVFLLLLALGLAAIITEASIDVDAMVKKMTYEEKCGQMTQITFAVIQKEPADYDNGDDDQIDEAKLIAAIRDYHVGSILNTPLDTAQKKATWQKITTKIQKFGDEHSKSKIPVLFGIDSIHGANYIREAVLFPQPLSMAASWNLDIVRQVSRITALETRSVGIPWNFNPVLDVGRQPLWSRLFETYGEDSYLASKFATVYVEASQKPSLQNRSTTITCLKHFIGYSLPFNGRDRSVALIPEITLRDHFLPPFEAGVLAGSPTVMINSGEVNGVPGHGNSHYINDILKGELGFTGFTVSDWEDIKRLYTRDKVAESMEQAVRLGVMSGLDMSMVPFDYSFYDHCVDLTKKNDTEFMARVDDANKRILKVKDLAGLFDGFGVPNEADLVKVGSEESENINLDAARESIILASNDKDPKILPLQKSAKILVTGPTGDQLHVLNGAWSYSWQGRNESFFRKFGNEFNKKLTVFGALKELSDNGETNVRFVEGVSFEQVIDIDAVVKAAADVDVIVLCVGEDSYTETLGNIDDLMLSDSQLQLADAIIATGKPYVVVYLGGRPRIMTNVAQKASAVVLGFLPGNRGGEAIAEVLFGMYNPNGKLPITYPKAPAGYTTYDYKPLENLNGNTYDYLYPFGHGLSYTSYQYSGLVVETVENNKKYSVTLKVKNVGALAGKETVILYLEDEFGCVSRPARQVRGFQKIELQAGEERTVAFELTLADLMFTNQYNQRVYEAGKFNVYVGDQKGTFTLTQSSPTLAPTTSADTTSSGDTTTTPKAGSTITNANNLLVFASMLVASALFSF